VLMHTSGGLLEFLFRTCGLVLSYVVVVSSSAYIKLTCGA